VGAGLPGRGGGAILLVVSVVRIVFFMQMNTGRVLSELASAVLTQRRGMPAVVARDLNEIVRTLMESRRGRSRYTT
jgi:hypothetical protein